MIYEGMDVENRHKNSKTNATLLGMPRPLAYAAAALLVVAVGWVGLSLWGNKQTNAVSAETIEKVHACVGDRTANITRRARSDASYAADREAIKRDVAEANKACESQYGVKEMPARTASQIHTNHSPHNPDSK